ncbi:LysR family transcriptional regulator [Occallatibacter riparius]|uniref:LysR family transcriptional regulator n=1 Tax=Occallatibacter riparius TaxID=1002689 RepID=A0A9J7BQA2_9BACT|nr:LysR family transcriptional regulator [Occallatibacter riparius]UWZ83118.1 LysR family transcriptional regulator [Occallatibacter riparius]
MEVRQLQIFCILAEELRFTRAAERAHTVQSNVTAQIKSLEHELGVKLFDRLGHRIVLTEPGQRFRQFAIQALNAMEEGKRAVAPDADLSGPLRIGAPESVLAYRLPQIVSTFREQFPRIELVFRPHVGASVFGDLETGKIDFAFHMCDTFPKSLFCSTRLYRERILLLCAPSDDLARQVRVKPTHLAGKNLLLPEHGCAYRSKFERMLSSQKILPGHVTEFSSVEAIKQCAMAGMGIALLPAIAVGRELDQAQCIALRWAGTSLDVSTQLAWHRSKWISPALTAFQDVVRNLLRNQHPAPPGRRSYR